MALVLKYPELRNDALRRHPNESYNAIIVVGGNPVDGRMVQPIRIFIFGVLLFCLEYLPSDPAQAAGLFRPEHFEGIEGFHRHIQARRD